MFGWIFGKRVNKLEEETKKSFNDVKRDMDVVGKWIKHLDRQHKQLFNSINSVKMDLPTVKGELMDMRNDLNLVRAGQENKQVFKKLPILDKQTGVEGVGKAVQTAVQTANFYDILKELSGNERLLVMTIMNNDMKLSYEDLALLLGKERSTIRGQVNAIKQKKEGLIEEMVEKSGKKRIFVPAEIKEKLAKYAKVRGGKTGKRSVKDEEREEEDAKE